MGIGYLLGGILCLAYAFPVVIFGGIKKSPGLLKLVKMKLGKGMSDEKAAKICLVFGSIVGLIGIVLLVIGAIQG